MDVSRLDDYTGEFDPGFEPQTRVRSNTWPLRPKEFLKPSVTPTDDGSHTPTTISEGDESQDGQTLEQALRDDGKVDPHSLGNSKKGTSRRNAWGNLSYADLITKAIQSSPDQRLTLSQIYDWMVQNVPYFKDKGDSNSSAGWKNSIRHNLSLHSRFMRMQNEGTGKSSWWVINQDAKPGKSPRRRHTMDSKEYTKKRPGRGGKKKLEALKAGSSGTDNDFFPDSPYEQLSPGEFRTRTQSNASSIGGRLSPIPDPDLHDKHVPPETASPIPWSSLDTGNINVGLSAYTNGGDTYGAEQMGNSFAEVMKLDGGQTYSNQDMILSSGGTMSTNGEFANEWQAGGFEEIQFGPLPAPPPYPVRQSPQNGVMMTQNEMNVGPITQNGSSSSSYTLMDISQQNMGQCNNSMYQEPLMGQDPMVSGLQNPNSNQYTSFNNSTSNFNARATSSNIFPMEASSQNRMTNNSMLRAALSAAKPQILVTTPQRSGNTTSVVGMQQQQQHPPLQYGVLRQGLFQPIQPNFTEGDASLEGLEPDDGLQCDISEVLRQEMLMGGGNLDFSFDQFPPNNNTASDAHHIAN